MKLSNNTLTLYTSQRDIVLKTLEEEGLYQVKKEYIEKKYGEVAGVFLEAYNWFIRKARDYQDLPEDSSYPIWLFTDPSYVEKHPGSKVLTLEVPREEALLFSAQKWNKILNLSYLEKDPEDLQNYEAELKRLGITREQDIFFTSFYPLQKRRVIKSWDRLFQEDIIPAASYQAALFQLKKQWIFSID